jgi:hypothetical protein
MTFFCESALPDLSAYMYEQIKTTISDVSWVDVNRQDTNYCRTSKYIIRYYPCLTNADQKIDAIISELIAIQNNQNHWQHNSLHYRIEGYCAVKLTITADFI